MPDAHIHIDTSSDLGPVPLDWNMFGHDEANWALTPHGRSLLDHLARLAPDSPPLIRTHNLLTTGDPEDTSLKWSATNVYTHDQHGEPVLDFTALDRLFDAYLEHGVRPLVKIGFMPKALSSHPEPYRHDWERTRDIRAGWNHPPTDYHAWGELVYQWASHCGQRYGKQEASSWLWEVWNEPDIGYWSGTADEYCRLYDFAAHGLKRALPDARIGGPHTTAPKTVGDKSDRFLRRFLEHIVDGTNHVTGTRGSPLDYIGFHTKGLVQLIDGRVHMGLQIGLARADRAMRIIAEYPSLRGLPVILGECDPEGTAAFAPDTHPENRYRQGPIYPVYVLSMLRLLRELAGRHGLDLAGVVTWAFHFEGSPWFAGYRELATNGVPKAVLNAFRMLGMLRARQLAVASDHEAGLDAVLEGGVRGGPDVTGLAARDEEAVTVLLWNYHDVEDIETVDAHAAPVTLVTLVIEHLPWDRVRVEGYRLDEQSSNPHHAWSAMGSPCDPTPEQIALLREASGLQPLDATLSHEVTEGRLELEVTLPRPAASLLRLSAEDASA